MDMKTIDYIKKHGWESIENLGIKVTWHKTLPLAILNYEQWADKFNPVVLECRGLVLDRELNVVCLPMYRFFNYGEVDCERDFSKAVAFEKLDGTMINVWYYEDKWFISTRNSFGDAQTAWGNTFDSLVRPLVDGKLINVFGSGAAENWTHVFELTGPENRVLTPYKEHELYYLTSINKLTGIESDILFSFKEPKRFTFTNKDEIDHALASLPELEEGYVVCWPDYFRLKVKNPAYLARSKTKGVHFRNSNNGALSQRRAMEMYFEGDADEYLLCYPEDYKLFEFIDKWEKLVSDYDIEYFILGNTRAEKAIYIKETYPQNLWPILFSTLDGKNPRTYLNNLPITGKIKLLGEN